MIVYNKEKLELVMSYLYKVCIYVTNIFILSSKANGFTYYYKVFCGLTITFGIWLYYIKNDKFNLVLKDVLEEFSIPFIGAIIIGKIMGDIDFSDLYQMIIPIMCIIGAKVYRKSNNDFIKLSKRLKKDLINNDKVKKVRFSHELILWTSVNLMIITTGNFNLLIMILIEGILTIIEKFIIEKILEEL